MPDRPTHLIVVTGLLTAVHTDYKCRERRRPDQTAGMPGSSGSSQSAYAQKKTTFSPDFRWSITRSGFSPGRISF